MAITKQYQTHRDTNKNHTTRPSTGRGNLLKHHKYYTIYKQKQKTEKDIT